MADVNGDRRTSATEETVVEVHAANYTSGNTFYLEPGETLEILDDDPNLIEVTVVERDDHE